MDTLPCYIGRNNSNQVKKEFSSKFDYNRTILYGYDCFGATVWH